MKLIVGLGNPGLEYNFTRHNFGFLVLDYYFKVNGLVWEKKPKFGAIWAKSDDKIYVKPQKFYNASGEVVRDFMNYYKISLQDILIICDDFYLEFGKTRYRTRGSSGGNNGLKSIISELKTEDFPRIRLGTGNEDLRRRVGDINFVLSRFTADEKQRLPEILATVAEKISYF
ncbi:MAG: aminoacyl-tRNA hydrolase [Candidatus Saccharibacteria bacterium]|nr:aminoacyl-tRNA hydrolase [Candidatus Saccharibacteria bacterium]